MIKRRVLMSQPRTIWISAGEPLASNFAWDKPGFLGTGSSSPICGRSPKKIAKGAAVSQRLIAAGRSSIHAIMLSKKQSQRPNLEESGSSEMWKSNAIGFAGAGWLQSGTYFGDGRCCWAG